MKYGKKKYGKKAFSKGRKSRGKKRGKGKGRHLNTYSMSRGGIKLT